MRLEEGQTKDRIIMLLKRTEGMTAEDMSRQIGITPMGIRQHLLSLERKGMVEYEARKHGIGRPVFMYKLTHKADDVFPKGYDRFAVEVLKDIESLDGRNKVDELFRIRKDRLLKDRMGLMEQGLEFPDRVKALSRILQQEGYFVELKENGRDSFLLNQFNCPLSKVATYYPEACKYELELYNELFGKSVLRNSCMAQGDPSCTFLIPPG
jgi:predicted ArsR family transcriptional regulator